MLIIIIIVSMTESCYLVWSQRILVVDSSKPRFKKRPTATSEVYLGEIYHCNVSRTHVTISGQAQPPVSRAYIINISNPLLF